MRQKDLQFWIGFSKVPGIGPVRLRALLDYYGDVETAWGANPGELRAIGLDKRSIENLVKVRHSVDLEAEMETLDQLRISVLTWESPNYPKLLKNIPDPPAVLYVRGQLNPQDEWAVGVVGTRQATTYGKESTRLLVSGLVSNGVTIVSGLAYGIDTQAHKTTVEQKGRTIAVLGSSVEIIYPPENRKLAEAVVENGALVSEYPLGTKPEGGNFPRRNRIISGLSLGILFVEGNYKSGARITVDYALDQGREVMAVPGSILHKNGSGANHLIQNGAKLVTSVEDILEELNLTMISQQAEARAIIPDNAIEATLLKQLSTEPVHVDELGRLSGLSASEIASTLTMMELKGMVRQVGGMTYIIARETPTNYIID
ncbi:MAG: DNA-protecting protein DprA [Anaerolineaceae bacterium]|nr:DNA-protecting protein DprA [Anaerolineaceae bacterium]MCB9101615.1 DNA-protecting protein DprA [Anaerolineales bacterium]